MQKLENMWNYLFNKKGQYGIMETNQKSKLKRNMIAAVLVIMVLAIVSMMCFLCVKMNHLENNLTVLQARLEGQKSNETFDSVKQQEYPTEEATPVPLTEAEQVVSSAIVAQRPADISGTEPEAAHKVYLTFDDGPSKNTEKILDILENNITEDEILKKLNNQIIQFGCFFACKQLQNIT